MNAYDTKVWLVASVALLGLSLSAATVQAQCNVIGTNTGVAGSYTTIISKGLAASYVCQSVPGQMNAYACAPGSGGGLVANLTATAMSSTMAPQCVWNCACGQITIDSSDGLPVELLRFGVE